MKKSYYILPTLFLLTQINSAVADDDAIWSTRGILNGQAGMRNSYGQADIMQPLAGDDYSLLYVNGSALLGVHSMSAYDLGFGYRQIISNDYILGGYSYFDHSRPSETDFQPPYFSQVVVGGELLGNTWDFRANGYMPVGKKTAYHDYYYSPIVAGHTVAVHDKQTYIRALSGADVEAGRTIPNVPSLKAYLGYYHFGSSGSGNVTGASARLEYKINNNITLTATEKYDNNQHNQAFLGARISLGGVIPDNAGLQNCDDCIEYRMEDMAIRQPTIMVNRQVTKSVNTDPRQYYYVNNNAPAGGDGTYEHPYQSVQQAVAAAGANNVIYTYQGNGTYNLDGQLNMQSGQYLTGSGGDYYYQGVKIFSGTGAPVLNGRINVANGNTLSNFTLDGTGTGQNVGIYGNGVSNITISNISVINFSGLALTPILSEPGSSVAAMNGDAAYGILLTNSSNVTLNHVTVSNITGGDGQAGNNAGGTGDFGTIVGGNGGNGGNAVGIDLDGDQNVTIDNTTVSNINAGAGGAGGNAQVTGISNTVTGGTGGIGGSAIGISLANSSNTNINNTSVNNVNAGNGGTGGQSVSTGGANTSTGGTGGTGGSATGIKLTGSNSINLKNITVNSVIAGSSTGGISNATDGAGSSTGGNAGISGNAVGIDLSHIQHASINNININTVTGGNSIGGDAHNTNTSTTGFITSATGGAGSAGGNATGIDLTSANAVSVSQVNVTGITGGASQGGLAQEIGISTTEEVIGGSSAAGGNATGINMTNASNVSADHITVNTVQGGASIAGGATANNGTGGSVSTGGNSGNGGNATAIDLTDANTVALSNITVSNLTGGSSTAGNASSTVVGGIAIASAHGGNSGNGGSAIGVNATGGINLNLDLPSFNFVNLAGGSSTAGTASAAGGGTNFSINGTAGTTGAAENVVGN